MRIDKISLTNYRQFRAAEFVFSRGPHDMHLVIGLNGSGKTNLLNAVNWCLYGDEPHAANDGRRLPIANLEALHTAPRDSELVVEVSVRADSPRSGEVATFIRRQVFRRSSEEGNPVALREELEVQVGNDSAGVTIFRDDAARRLVDRFVPKHIREYFFFDGERLDDYFREQSTQKIEAAILQLSRLDVLERMESRLSSVHLALSKENFSQNKAVSDLSSRYEEAERRAAATTAEVERLTDEQRCAKGQLQTLEAELRGIPDVSQVEAERQTVKTNIDDRKRRWREKESEQASALRLAATLLFLSPALRPVMASIQDMEARNKLPPPVERRLIETIVESNRCTICGRPLDIEAVGQVRSLLDRLQFSSEDSVRLLALGRHLQMHLRAQVNSFSQLDRIANEVTDYEHDIEELQARLQLIENQLRTYDVERIRLLHRQRRTFELQSEELLHRVWTAKVTAADCEKQRDDAHRKLETAYRTLASRGVPVEVVQFALAAHDALRDAKARIRDNIRSRVEAETKTRFLSMVQRVQTFADVRIGPDFVVQVVHQLGYNCIGSLGAAERELLAMAFTLAVHRVSGFEAPLLVDTPVARVSDENRANFAQELGTVSQEKQIILLLTSAEHNGDVSRLLDPIASTRYRLSYSEGELVTRVEVL